MSFFVLCLLCLVQGFTEFLPVSSSGHLFLIEQIFKIEENLLLLNLFLHLATLIAVVIYYRKILLNLLRRPFQPLTYKLIISTLITICFAVIYKVFNLQNLSSKFYGFCFIITSIFLFSAYIFQKKSLVLNMHGITYKNAFIVGIVQGFAVLPGISRSGSTISTLILLGNDENESSEYSFLLSIPIIVGGFLVELFEIKNYSKLFLNINYIHYIIGFFLTFLVSFLSLKITIKLLKNQKFNWFALYTFIIGIIILLVN